MFNLVKIPRPATQPVSMALTDVFKGLTGSKCPERAPGIEVDAEAATVTTFLASRPWAAKFETGPATGQIDMYQTLRLLLIMHFPNPEMRDALYRHFLQRPDRLREMEAKDALVSEYGQPSSPPETWIAPDMWVMIFNVMRLSPYNTNYQQDRLVFKEDFLTLQPHDRYTDLPNTEAFVLFQTNMLTEMDRNYCASPTISNNLYHDTLLLYFAAICLIGKNARELLDHPHFDYLGTKIAYQQSTTFRDTVYGYLKRADPNVEIDGVNSRDHYARIEAHERTWINLLEKLCFSSALPKTSLPGVAPAPPQAAPSMVVIPPSVAPQPATAPATTIVIVPTAPAPAPPAEEQPPEVPAREVPGAPPPTPPRDEDVTDEGTAEVAPATDEQTAARIRTLIGASISGHCPHHHSGSAAVICSAKCMQQRLGAPIVRSTQRTNTVLAAPMIRYAATQVGTERAASALMAASLLKDRPAVAKTLIGTSTLPSMLPRQTGDWCTLNQLLVDANPTSGCDLVGIDMLAKYAGWMNCPASERAQRFVAVYSGAPIDDMFKQHNWTPLSQRQKELVKAYKKANVRPSVRTTQVLMHMAGTDKN